MFYYINTSTGEVSKSKAVYNTWVDSKGIIDCTSGKVYPTIPNSKEKMLDNIIRKYGHENAITITFATNILQYQDSAFWTRFLKSIYKFLMS